MKELYVYLCAFILAILFIVIILKVAVFYHVSYPAVYAVMVTGKDDIRIAMASISMRNFFNDQMYRGSKKMIIVNHHPDLDVQVPSEYAPHVLHVRVSKDKNSLGSMRNIALEMIPTNALWTTWDDDDYRSPDYLVKLFKHMSLSNASAAAFTNRYEYNSNTNSVWRMQLRTGFVTMLCRKIPGYYYLDANSMEDTNIKAFYQNQPGGISICDNAADELMYIRLVHANNTSMYVNSAKYVPTLSKSPDLKLETSKAEYGEYPVTEREKVMVEKLMRSLVSRL